MHSVLIIDDEPTVVSSLVFALEEEGFEANGAATGREGLSAAQTLVPDLVLLDLNLPDMSGIDVLGELQRLRPGMPVIMVSAQGDARTAVRAVKGGAADYITKPFDLDDLLHAIGSTLERTRLQAEVDFRRREAMGRIGLVGRSAALRELELSIQRIARSQAKRILVLGESGTGKALVARAVHNGSTRAAGPFIEVNCASLPEQLIEAELFGAEKGSYTGATQRRAGLVALADGGTLLLDEIGELPLALQAKVLHFLEDGQYRPVGAARHQVADVRVIAATNRDLAAEVAQGTYREDLYYRLNVLQVLLPPLRERDDDAVMLAEHFAAVYAAAEGCAPVCLTADARRCFVRYPWPGNVRELKNLIERLTILSPGCDIEPGHLPAAMRGASAPDSAPFASAVPHDPGSFAQRLAAEEERLLTDALRQSQGHKGRAAEILGISRHALQRRLQRLGLR